MRGDANRAAEDLPLEFGALFDAAPLMASLHRGPDHVVVRANARAMASALGRPVIGEPISSIFPGLADRGVFEPFDRAFRDGVAVEVPERSIDAKASEADPLPRHWVRQSIQPWRDADGEVAGVVAFTVDITQEVEAREALREAERRSRLFRLVAEASPDFIGIADLAHGPVFANATAMAMAGLSEEEVRATPVPDFFVPEERAHVRDVVLPAALREGRWTGELNLLDRASGAAIPILYDVFRIDDPKTGEPTHLATITRDLTEARRARDQLQTLMDELNHRVKNTLALVGAMARMTLRDDRPAAEGRAAFVARLRSLAASHDALLDGGWSEAGLREVVQRALSPFGGPEPGRIEVEGPDEQVGSRAALALAMAIQELGTNALKHGALSVEKGRVRIAWAPEPGAAGELRFSWREGGGPPVRPPERRGFGTTLLEAALGADLDAPRLEYRPEGVRFECGVPFAGDAALGPGPSSPRGA